MVSDPIFRRAVFLDRDGVVNLDYGYVVRKEDFQFVPGVLEASRLLAERGFALVIASNQSGIGRGLYSEADFFALTAWVKEQFAAAGAPLAGVYYCPHHPTEATAAYRVECECRKPAPGMLLRAAHELSLDLSRSVMFGDKATDLNAARAAGVPHRILLGTDGREMPADIGALATARFRSLAEAVASPALAKIIGATRYA
jgi:D-glycero-D-manno-heptose 1,7-bisphosphate phosphatase